MEPLDLITSCNLCGSRHLEDIYASTWVKGCAACGFVFRSPRPSAAAIARFYSRDGKYSHWLEEMQGRRACWHYRLKQLLRFAHGGRLLDIGAGIGEFLHYASRHFDVSGTEVSVAAVRLVKLKFRLDLQPGAVEELRRRTGPLLHNHRHNPAER